MWEMGQRASGSIFGPKEKVSQESYDKIHFFLCFFIFFSNCVSEKNKENVDNKSTNDGDDKKIIPLKRNMGQA